MHRTATVGNPPTDELGIGEFLWCLDKASKKIWLRTLFLQSRGENPLQSKEPCNSGKTALGEVPPVKYTEQAVSV